MTKVETMAAEVPVPTYAIDDQTAIKVSNGRAEVVSEGRWKLLPVPPQAAEQGNRHVKSPLTERERGHVCCKP